MQGCNGTERAPQRAPAAARDLAEFQKKHFSPDPVGRSGLSVAFLPCSLYSNSRLGRAWAWAFAKHQKTRRFFYSYTLHLVTLRSRDSFSLEVKASESRTSQLSAPSGRACDTQAGFQHVSDAQTHRPWRNAWRNVKSYKVKQYLTDFLISHHASFMKFLSYSNLLTRLLIYRTLWESARSYSNCMQSQTQGELKYEGCIVSRDIAFSSRCLLWTCVYVRPQKQPCQ